MFGVGVKCESLGQILFAKPKHFPKLKINKDLEIKIQGRTKTVVEIIQAECQGQKKSEISGRIKKEEAVLKVWQDFTKK